MVAKKKVVKTSKKPKPTNNQCEVCKLIFSRSGRLALHMVKKHGIVWVKKTRLVPTPDNPRPHKCDSCDNTFIRRKHLLRHRISKHIGSKCAECDEKFVKLKEHMVTVHKKKLQLPYECHLCKQQYKSKQCIKTHMQVIHCNLNQTFQCPLCEEVMQCREVYRRHRNRHKYDRNRFNKRICEVCGKAILVSQFRKHEKTHSEGQLKCSFCEKLFKNQASVKLHERTHTQERPYECEVCHNRFIDGSTLRVHRRNHTGESPFVCHLCGRRTKQAQNLASHYRHFHRNFEVTSKLIRFNARVLERYDNGVLERCLREDGDLTRLLATGTIEYNREMEEKNRDKELAEQRKFEEVQKLNVRTRVFQKDVIPFKVPKPIEQINVDAADGSVAEAAAGNELDQFIVKCESDELEYSEVKVEPTLDVLGEVDCDRSEFPPIYDIKVEEPLHSNDIIDAIDSYFEDPQIHSSELKIVNTKLEAGPSDPIAAPNIIYDEPVLNQKIKKGKPGLPADKTTIAKLSFCHICNVHYANPSVCATHMLKHHNIEQPDIPRPHKCLLCEKSYGRSSHLWRHYEKRHDGAPDPKIEKMRKQKVTIKIVRETLPETVPDSVQADGAELDVAPEAISEQATALELDEVAPDKNAIAQLSYCHICDRKYANQGSCAAHMLEVHNLKLPEIRRSYKCLLCTKSYTRSNHLARHYASAHGDTDRNMKIRTKTDQTLGNTSMEIIQQDAETNCEPITALENVRLGNAADAEAAKPSLCCEICDRNYSKRANLIIHMWGVHKIKITSSQARPHKCLIKTCKKSYKSRKSLLQHYRKDHGGNPERKWKRTSAEIESGSNDVKVEIPEDVVTSKARSICLICDKRYANHWACAVHMMQVHKIKMPELERPHSCDECHKSYVTRGHLARHLKATHGIGGKRTSNEANGFECYMCHEEFKLSELLKKHTSKMHLPAERSSICPTCGLSTPRLGRHIMLAHSVKESQCQICQRVYSHPSRLTSHMKTHTLPAQCDLCPKRFASNGAMRQHRRYHTMEKPYACKYCDHRFIERSTCTQHERTHTGEKPYRCHICDARTIQAGNLKSHYRHFHKMIVKHVSMTKLVTDAEMIPIA